MSEIERLKRMQGLRASQPLAMTPAIPVIDHCKLRQDSIASGGVLPNSAVGSFLFSAAVQAAGVIAASSFLFQLPSLNDGTIITAAGPGLDATRFAKPGWWKLRFVVHATQAALGGCRMIFLPWDTRAKTYQLRPFQGTKAGAFSPPILTFFAPAGAAIITDYSMELDTFFPEPWGAQVDAGAGLAANDRFSLVGTFVQDCALDDIQAAVDPVLAP